MPRVNILVALAISALMLAGVLYFNTSAFVFNTAQIAILVLVALAWLGLFLSSSRIKNHSSVNLMSQNDTNQKSVSKNEVKQVSDGLMSLVGTLKTELEVQITATKAELMQVKSLMDDAIDDLVDSFISLEASTRIEQKLVMLLASNVAENDNDDLNPFKEKQLKSKQLLSEISVKLNTLIKDAKHNESACKALNNIEQDSENSITALETLLEKINLADMKQEVKVLFADEVRKHAQELHGLVGKAGETVEKLYTDSKVYTDESKDIANKINEIMDENANNISIVADEIALTTAQIEKDVQTAVRSLQFQDMTTQLITQCGERQKVMQDILNTTSTIHLNNHDNSLPNLLLTLSNAQAELKQLSKARMKQFNVDSGSVELF